MKDLVSSLLNLNIYIQRSNIIEKRLFGCAIEAIKYYWSIKPLTSTEFIFI